MTGDRRPSQVSRPLERLQRKGIDVVRGEVERVDPEQDEILAQAPDEPSNMQWLTPAENRHKGSMGCARR